MDPGIDIHRRADGSIDIDRYIRRARADRDASLKRCVWAAIALPGGLLRWLGAALRDAFRRSERA